MKIRSVTTNGLAGLADRTYAFASASSGAALDRVVVSGPRASGKTRLLDAIVLVKELAAPYGKEPFVDGWLRAGEDAAKIELEWTFDEAERERVGLDAATAKTEVVIGGPFGSSVEQDPRVEALLGDFFFDPTFGKVEYFADCRDLPGAAAGILLAAYGRDDHAAQKGLRLSKENAKYDGLTQLILEASLGTYPGLEDLGLERLQFAFDQLCPTKSLAGIVRARDGFHARFSDASGALSGVDGLTASERQALLFATTFLRIGLSNSVVLIDTPELHLADDEVLPFVTALERLGGNNQLVFATRSSALAGSAGRDGVINLAARERKAA